MEAIILGNPYDLVQGSATPISIPAYQSEQTVIVLADGSVPIDIGSGSGSTSNLYPLDVHSDSVDLFHITNASTTQITLSLPTIDSIKSLTINGIEYYEGIDFYKETGNKILTFNASIPYDPLYGDTIIKVVYTQVNKTSAYISGSSISFSSNGTGMTSTDVQSAIVEAYTHSDSTGTWGNISGTISNQTDLMNTLSAKENTLGVPSTNGYVLSSTTSGIRSWIAQVGAGEPSLGNPSVNDYILSSTTAGVRSWVANANGYLYANYTTKNYNFSTNHLSLRFKYLTSGTDNYGSGSTQFSSLTSGVSNTITDPSFDVQNLTSGSYNTAYGSGCSPFITTGSYNTSYGSGSLYSSLHEGNNNSAFGYQSGNAYNGNNGIFLGNFSGNYTTTPDNVLIINSLDRTNYAGDASSSIIYGIQNTTPSSQTLALNAQVTATYGMNIPAGQTYKINGVPISAGSGITKSKSIAYTLALS